MNRRNDEMAKWALQKNQGNPLITQITVQTMNRVQGAMAGAQ
jgi:hypothetical protein